MQETYRVRFEFHNDRPDGIQVVEKLVDLEAKDIEGQMREALEKSHPGLIHMINVTRDKRRIKVRMYTPRPPSLDDDDLG